ncbi:putative protein YPL067C [Talaromyces islandicus]|uniref:N-acetylglucosamine-induced protein 1 n=1 Tax=Talaromyces islandicus TaxID=28573 RepID=A0A0U1LXI1_TALIS|nr:putative protein YPL067C [Talaromyces islandicus]
MSAETFTNIDTALTDVEPGADAASQANKVHLTAQQPLPYWLVNVPRSQWPATCPDFLKDLPDKNIGILATLDADYRRLNWDGVKDLVRRNDIGKFQRVPSDLRRYLEYMFYIKQKYGSVMDFVLMERLHWDASNLKPQGPAFQHNDDFKVLYNDWPYGLDPEIVHLVVWTKFDLDEDPATGLLTDSMWKKIDTYIEKTFRSRIPSDQIIWFKNWKSLKSIHAIEHFHVMLYKPDRDFIADITHGDVPLVEKITQGA